MQVFPVIVTLELTVGMPAEGTRLLLLSSDPLAPSLFSRTQLGSGLCSPDCL